MSCPSKMFIRLFHTHRHVHTHVHPHHPEQVQEQESSLITIIATVTAVAVTLVFCIGGIACFQYTKSRMRRRGDQSRTNASNHDDFDTVVVEGQVQADHPEPNFPTLVKTKPKESHKLPVNEQPAPVREVELQPIKAQAMR